MTVQDMLDELARRGFDTTKAQLMVSKTPDIANTPVIKTDRYKTRAGAAIWKRIGGAPIEIKLARWLWRGGWEPVYKTFMHELAHLFTPGDGHSARWRKLAIAFGDDGKTCHEHDFSNKSKLKVVAECSACNRKYTGHKYLPRNRSYRCHCGNPNLIVYRRS